MLMILTPKIRTQNFERNTIKFHE